MDKWISIAAVTMAATVAACTASQDSFKVQPVLSFDGKPVKDSGAAEYQKGKQLLSQGRFALAAQAFQTSLYAGGSSVEVLNALAVSYDKLGRYDLSDRYYQRALTLDPNNPQTINNLAVSLAQRGAPDLAAKVLSDAHTQRPSDTTIADNLKLAQKEATAEPSAGAVAPLSTPIAPAVPRIEQTGPSTQRLVTIGARADAAPHQPASTPVTIGITGDRVSATTKADETDSAGLGASARPPAAVSEPPAIAQKVATIAPPHVGITLPSPATQQLLSTDATRPDARLRPAVAPVMVSGTADAEPTATDEVLTVSAPARRPIVTSEILAPPPIVGKAQPPSVQKTTVVPPLQTASALPAKNRPTAVPPQLASEVPVVHGNLSATEPPVMTLARSRLGSRIVESDNIQPRDVAPQKSNAPELALARLGVRVEVANGAGRRYMAARMRTFLEGRGFDVMHIINARSFEHVQTVIAYRDQYQQEALSLAKSLATKVEFVRVADLPVDVRLILGRDLLAFDRTLANGG